MEESIRNQIIGLNTNTTRLRELNEKINLDDLSAIASKNNYDKTEIEQNIAELEKLCYMLDEFEKKQMELMTAAVYAPPIFIKNNHDE